MTPELRPAGRADAPAVAELHAHRIAEGFLATLGQRFLTRLYRRIARSDWAVLLVAERDGRIIGFVAAAASTGRLYREFLVRDGVLAGVSAAPAILRSPRRVWETLRYGATSDDLPGAEILSIAVAADAAGAGVGGALLAGAVAALVQRGADGVRVLTGTGNSAAIAMYERGGFVRHSRTDLHSGVPQEVLVWR